MIVGIPKGLLYYKYYPFFTNFFNELGVELVVSQDTNKDILDEGVNYCIDDACLPVKIFHGHVAVLKEKCDIILIPRIMQVRKKEYICPKFCGLPEMIKNTIPDLPRIIDKPIYAFSRKKLYTWAKEAGSMITKDKNRIKSAFNYAVMEQDKYRLGFNDKSQQLTVALVGHPYNIFDNYINMNIVKKLKRLGVGVITEEFLEDNLIDEEIRHLYKKPFWTFARNSYGFASNVYRKNLVDGIIYISSFACGIDSVVIELIKERIGNFPLLILKIDEHTGEAGLDTRVEAFVDMLGRGLR
ncbi:MAG: 2-hydroxyglutaryl-CoA dehydratase [Tissierellia bacterium]|nr:2-hydroxyglutaryl-CoA dehydratase [Tissierellia bacterium]